MLRRETSGLIGVGGAPRFDDLQTPIACELVESAAFASGVVLHR